MKSSGSASSPHSSTTSRLIVTWCWHSSDDCGINILETDVPGVLNSITSLSKMVAGFKSILSLKSGLKSELAPSTWRICSGQEGQFCWTSGPVLGLLIPELLVGRYFLAQVFKAGHDIFDWLFLQPLRFFRGLIRVPWSWKNLQLEDKK